MKRFFRPQIVLYLSFPFFHLSASADTQPCETSHT